jgi:YVTN family beta-propeller protein
VGEAPFALAVSPDATRVYVANVRSADISVLSTETLSPIARIKVGAMPYGVAATADGSVLVANQSSGTVSVVEAGSLSIVKTFKVGRFPEGIALARRATKAYVANWFSGDVSVIDVANGRELKRIKTGGGARALVAVDSEVRASIVGGPAGAPTESR